MKYCVHCGRELLDEAVICPGCGCAAGGPYAQSPPPRAAYCTRCGMQIGPQATFCTNCGCPVGGAVPLANRAAMLSTLSEKVKTNGIIWIVIASVQIVAGIFGIFYDWWWVLIVGVLNLISAIQDLNYSKTMLANPTGIVAKFEPLAGAIVVLVYNVLFGGLIGVIGSVYYLVGIRSYVMDNRDVFASFG